MSSLVSTVAQLVWFSEHKIGVFIFAAVMLMLSGWVLWQAKSLPCPADSQLAETSKATRQASLRVYIVSLLIF